jgi:hypothetical protein
MAGLRAAADTVGRQKLANAVTAAIMNAARVRLNAPQGHLRRAFTALDFMANL